MCGTFTRHFYNNLCGFEGCRYLEIGSWKGASLCAAMFQNPIAATSIDNWSLFGGPRDAFMHNVARYKGQCDLTIIEDDCFKVDTRSLGPFNVFLYDGGHSSDAHYKALTAYYDTLEAYAVVIIDDWNWERVRQGTRKAIQELDLPILFDKEILLDAEDLIDMPRHKGKDTWWNGLYVMVIQKGLPSDSWVPSRKATSCLPG